jgi:hypothetical protein
MCIIFVTPPLLLVLGLLVCQSFGHPYLHLNPKQNVLLQISVVGLGFGMNVNSALAAKDVFLFTIGSILSTLILGTFIKWF